MSHRAGRIFAFTLTVAVGAATPAWARGTTERVSVSSGGAQGNDGTYGGSAISADGRYVTFRSDATNLVPGDTNEATDIFVRDRQTGTTRRVSVSSGGAQGNAGSFIPALSADGRFVAFKSFATNLVPGDTNGMEDTFVHDRQTGTTRRVSVGAGGVQGNGHSLNPAISADGRYVAFESDATNLVPGDTNEATDVFVRDRQTGTTRRVSVSSGGVQGNNTSFSQALSADGRFVAFRSDATNLVPGDTNGMGDVFVRDRQTGTTRRVSVSSGGAQGNNPSFSQAISAGGRFVVFGSDATNLVPGDTNHAEDVFVHDRRTGTTRRVSAGAGGVQGNGENSPSGISAGGRFVVFWSLATNLVPGDTNNVRDIFVRDRQTGTTRRVSVSSGGAQGNEYSDYPAISADGRLVVHPARG